MWVVVQKINGGWLNLCIFIYSIFVLSFLKTLSKLNWVQIFWQFSWSKTGSIFLLGNVFTYLFIYFVAKLLLLLFEDNESIWAPNMNNEL